MEKSWLGVRHSRAAAVSRLSAGEELRAASGMPLLALFVPPAGAAGRSTQRQLRARRRATRIAAPQGKCCAEIVVLCLSRVRAGVAVHSLRPHRLGARPPPRDHSDRAPDSRGVLFC